jgi:hypothetical protein
VNYSRGPGVDIHQFCHSEEEVRHKRSAEFDENTLHVKLDVSKVKNLAIDNDVLA